MSIFTKKITQEDVDKLNTFNALSERPMIKVCKLCKHYYSNYGNDQCNRDMYPGFNRVTGADDMLGEMHYCENERELKGDRQSLVKSGDYCGAIGQFWEPAPAPAKVGFFRKMIKRNEKELK